MLPSSIRIQMVPSSSTCWTWPTLELSPVVLSNSSRVPHIPIKNIANIVPAFVAGPRFLKTIAISGTASAQVTRTEITVLLVSSVSGHMLLISRCKMYDITEAVMTDSHPSPNVMRISRHPPRHILDNRMAMPKDNGTAAMRASMRSMNFIHCILFSPCERQRSPAAPCAPYGAAPCSTLSFCLVEAFESRKLVFGRRK